MNKTCEICCEQARYKCPTCMIFYCSVPCCKKHRQNKCDVLQKDEQVKKDSLTVTKRKIDAVTESTVPETKLRLLDSNEAVNNLLTNGHLRNLLVAIDKSDDADEVMQKAMQEPIFVEFADACLKLVEERSEDEETT